jgi:hypothetical protein
MLKLVLIAVALAIFSLAAPSRFVQLYSSLHQSFNEIELPVIAGHGLSSRTISLE